MKDNRRHEEYRALLSREVNSIKPIILSINELELKPETVKPLAMTEASPTKGLSHESVKRRKGKLMKSTVETTFESWTILIFFRNFYKYVNERELNDYSEPKQCLAWFYSYKRCAEAKADPQCVGGPIQLNPFSME